MSPASAGGAFSPSTTGGTARSWTDWSEGAGGLVCSAANTNDAHPNPIANTKTAGDIDPVGVSNLLI
jgi:hypothetical protein